MARCGYCGTFILFGGLRDSKARYCNERCRNAGRVTAASLQVPDDKSGLSIEGPARNAVGEVPSTSTSATGCGRPFC
jgi:hypothetical protein